MAQEQRELSAALSSLNTLHVSLKARITAAEWQRPFCYTMCLPTRSMQSVLIKIKDSNNKHDFNKKISELLKAHCCQTGYSPLHLEAKYLLPDPLTLLVWGLK